jgi:hypothetical protein
VRLLVGDIECGAARMITGLEDLERERLLLIGRDVGDQDLSLRTMEIWGLW